MPSEIEALAGSVADTGGAYFVPAFSGLFAPHWRSDARGVIVGLARFHTKAHLARADAGGDLLPESRRRRWPWSPMPAYALDVLKVDGGVTANDSACRSRPTCSAWT